MYPDISSAFQYLIWYWWRLFHFILVFFLVGYRFNIS